MILEDKYQLKRRGSYRNYKDEVLDFITVFIDYFLSVYKPEFDKRNLNEYVRVMWQQRKVYPFYKINIGLKIKILLR